MQLLDRCSSSFHRRFILNNRRHVGCDRVAVVVVGTLHFLASSNTAPTTTTTTATTNTNTAKRKLKKLLLFEEELNILYDSKCIISRTEVAFLMRRDAQRRNKHHRRLRCTDLESGYYDPHDPANGGISYGRAMSKMHAVTQHGEIISGVAVFQRAYQIVGLGWLLTGTKYTGMRWIVDAIYNAFAKHRTKFTRGGATLSQLIEIYEERQKIRTQQQQQSSTNNHNRRCRRRRHRGSHKS